MILRCTNKLLAVIKPAQLADSAPDGEDWYANLLWLGGRKCLLLTHAATLFTIFEPDVRATGLRDPGRLVTGLIQRELEREHLPQDTFGVLEPGELVLAKTADRSVLGCMNDMAFLCEATVDRSGGLASTGIGELNRSLRRNINGARGYTPPVELTIQRLRVNIRWQVDRPGAVDRDTRRGSAAIVNDAGHRALGPGVNGHRPGQ